LGLYKENSADREKREQRREAQSCSSHTIISLGRFVGEGEISLLTSASSFSSFFSSSLLPTEAEMEEDEDEDEEKEEVKEEADKEGIVTS
jgi:hypothetical protein